MLNIVWIVIKVQFWLPFNTYGLILVFNVSYASLLQGILDTAHNCFPSMLRRSIYWNHFQYNNHRLMIISWYHVKYQSFCQTGNYGTLTGALEMATICATHPNRSRKDCQLKNQHLKTQCRNGKKKLYDIYM